MDTSQPQGISLPSASRPIRQAFRLAWFTAKTLFSKSKHNEVLAVVNALANPKCNPPSACVITVGQSDTMFDFSGLIRTTGSGPGTGNLNWRGLYDGGQNYAALDMVYTNPDASTRVAWVAEIANGPATSIHAPTWPEPGTVYWRAIANFSTGGISYYLVDSHGTGADTDYVFAHPIGGGASVKILKPPLILFSVTSRNGVSYSGWSATDQTRVASAAGTVLTQYITPKYLEDDILYVTTGPGGTLIDMNADNRTFAAP